MGLRVKRYGPQITNAEVGLVGLGVVPARRNRYAAPAARSTPATRSPQPRTLSSVVGVGHKRIGRRDRKSTRLNSSHTVISYAVFCLKTKTRRKTAFTCSGASV